MSTLAAIEGGRGRPSWAPGWAPSKATLDYINTLASIVLLALGILYFFGLRSAKPFAKRVAAV